MKKITILLAAILLVAFLIGTPIAYAEEREIGGELPSEETDEEETVEVPKDVWEEIIAFLEQLNNAQSGDDVKDVVENTLGARIREYFGESWGDIVLAGVFILVSIVLTFMNKKTNSTLISGVGTVYKTVKSTKDKISKKDEGNTLDEVIESSAEKSEAAERMSRASLEMIKLLVAQSNAKDTVKAEAENLYQAAIAEKRGQMNERE